MLVCAYLAAVFLCLDARREGHDDLADQFRIRSLGTAATTGAVGLVGIFVLRADAPLLFDGLVGRALPVLVVSVLAGLASIVLLVVRRYGLARITSSVAVATILIGWAVAQYPYLLLPYLTIEDAGRQPGDAGGDDGRAGARLARPGARAGLHVRAVLAAAPARRGRARARGRARIAIARRRRSAEPRAAYGRAPRDCCGEISPHRWIGAVEGFR